jgi:hypothetical protein
MALKAVVATLEGIPEALHPEYKQGEGGKWFLDLEGIETDDHPAVGALVRGKKRESEARVKAEAGWREAKEKLDTLNAEMEQRLKGTIPKADADRLEQSYKEKYAAREAELAGSITALNGSLNKILVQDKAKDLATEVALDTPHIGLILPHIIPRLAVEMVNGEATTRVLDKDGKPSAATLDDLKKEILATPMFAPVLKGSKATGSGAQKTERTGGEVPKSPVKEGANLSKLNPKDLAAHLASKAGADA